MSGPKIYGVKLYNINIGNEEISFPENPIEGDVRYIIFI